MPYRPVLLYGQAWVARIDADAVYEWYQDRDKLKERGFPDRPPDIDTPDTRAWIIHPDEEEVPFFQDQIDKLAERSVETVEQVFIMTADFHGYPVEYGVTSLTKETGEAEFRFRTYFPTSGNTMRWEVDPDDVESVFDSMLEHIAAPAITMPDNIVIAGYAEINLPTPETELAEREIGEYFRSNGWDLPDDWHIQQKDRMMQRAREKIAQRSAD